MGLLSFLSAAKERAERFLNEKNLVTDFLGKVEEKTGVKKKILAAGTLSCCVCVCAGSREDCPNLLRTKPHATCRLVRRAHAKRGDATTTRLINGVRAKLALRGRAAQEQGVLPADVDSVA